MPANETGRVECRVLIAKAGLDSHDRGARILARAMLDAGFEVVYLGTCADPASIGPTAVDEDVCVVGLSMHVGAHIAVARRVLRSLEELGGGDIPVVCGGIIPGSEAEELVSLGISAVADIQATIDDSIALFSRVCPYHGSPAFAVSTDMEG